MAHGPARIDNPEILKEFRNKMVIFEHTCRNALMGCDTQVRKTVDWLNGEQLIYWKTQLRKRDEAWVIARRDLEQAKMNSALTTKSSFVDEMKAVEKARRRKDEAEQKVDVVRRWAILLEQKIQKMQGPCRILSAHLDSIVPKALSRLDRMVTGLEGYFAAPPEEGP